MKYIGTQIQSKARSICGVWKLSSGIRYEVCLGLMRKDGTRDEMAVLNTIPGVIVEQIDDGYEAS